MVLMISLSRKSQRACSMEFCKTLGLFFFDRIGRDHRLLFALSVVTAGQKYLAAPPRCPESRRVCLATDAAPHCVGASLCRLWWCVCRRRAAVALASRWNHPDPLGFARRSNHAVWHDDHHVCAAQLIPRGSCKTARPLKARPLTDTPAALTKSYFLKTPCSNAH